VPVMNKQLKTDTNIPPQYIPLLRKWIWFNLCHYF
jgi:hypothetical protein